MKKGCGHKKMKDAKVYYHPKSDSWHLNAQLRLHRIGLLIRMQFQEPQQAHFLKSIEQLRMQPHQPQLYHLRHTLIRPYWALKPSPHTEHLAYKAHQKQYAGLLPLQQSYLQYHDRHPLKSQALQLAQHHLTDIGLHIF